MRRNILILACLWITGCSDCTDYIENDPKAVNQDAAFDFGPCDAGCDYSPSCVEPASVVEPPDVKTEDFSSRVAFLYKGEKAPQQCVAQERLDKTFVGVIRGTIKDDQGNGIGGVFVDLPDAPYLGHVYTRSDGSYEMVVNATGKYIVRYRHKDYLSATRHVTSRREDYAWVEPAILKKLDSRVTVVDFTRPVSMARGSVVEDASGKRQLTAMFHEGTRVKIIKPDGSESLLDSIAFRATEYTVGASGPDAMPAPLPPSTAYTYAVELSIDEAIAAQATEVRFDRPVPLYLENFLEFPVGTIVPSGYYDRQEQRWKASEDGVIIKVLGQTDDVTALDIDGDGQADSDGAIEALGISEAERGRIGRLYEKGQTLWRVPVKHFTPYDFNWGFSAPMPGVDPRLNDKEIEEEPCVQSGSIIECENRTLGEMLPIVGTPYRLSYRSDRQGQGSRSIPMQLTQQGDDLGDVERIDVIVEIAGQRHVHTVKNPSDDESWTFVWDGLDGFGRPVYGEQQAFVRINYLTWVEYRPTSSTVNLSFGQPINPQSPPLNDRLKRGQVAIDYTFTRRLGSFDAKSLYGLGGWMLDVQSTYDRQLQTLYPGDGPPRSRRNVSSIISPAFDFDAFDKKMQLPFEILEAAAFDLASGADGWVYMLIAARGQSGMQVIKHLPGTERWVHVAGALSTNATPEHNACTDQGQCGDDGLAVEAIMVRPESTNVGGVSLFEGASLAVSPLDGTVYVTSGRGCVRAVKGERITTVVGQCGANATDGEENDPKTPMYDITSLAAGVDGSLYIGRFGQIVQLTPAGRLRQIAGGGNQDYFEGIDALSMDLFPSSMAAGLDGRLYFRDSIAAYMIDLDNTVRKLSAQNELVTDVAVGEDNKVYIGNTRGVYVYENNQLRQYVGGRDFETLDASEKTRATEGNNIPALAFVGSTFRLSVGRQGVLWGLFRFPDTEQGAALRSVFSPFPNNEGEVYLPDASGQQVHVFDAFGQLQQILNGIDGSVELALTYDVNRRLIGLKNRFGLETTISYVADNVVITGPYGHETILSLNENDMLEALIYADDSRYVFEYTDGGLLTKMTKPNGASWTMTYDSEGKLLEDRDPVGGYKRLSQDDGGVQMSTAMNQQTKYRVEQGAQKQREVTSPDGTVAKMSKDAQEQRRFIMPDGTIMQTELAPDPRFGFTTPFVSRVKRTLPGDLALETVQTMNVMLSDATDLFSVANMVRTVSKNGINYQTITDDFQNKQRTVTSAEGREIKIQYNEHWQPIRVDVPGLLPVVYSYNPQGQMTSVEQGARRLTTTYAQGVVQSKRDALSRRVAIQYDKVLRPVGMIRQDQQSITTKRNPNGVIDEVVTYGNERHTYTHDARDMPTGYMWPGGQSMTMTYDLDSRPTEISHADGRSVMMQYDSSGRLDSVTYPEGVRQWRYDEKTGQIKQLVDGQERLGFVYQGPLLSKVDQTGTVSGSVQWQYNERFLVKQQQVNDAHQIVYGYDKDDLLTTIGPMQLKYHPGRAAVTETRVDQVVSTYDYSSYGQVSQKNVLHAANTLYKAEYTYDDVGRLIQLEERIGGRTTRYEYQYDVINRLIEVKRAGTTWQSYTYDLAGNRLSLTQGTNTQTGAYGSADQVEKFGQRTYVHNEIGQLTSWQEGNVQTSLVYGVFDELRIAQVGNKQITYHIDALGRRVGKDVDGQPVSRWLYQDKLNPVAELDNQGQVISRFIYGPYTHVPSMMFKGSTLYKIITDHLGSVRLVVDVQSGQIVQRLDYDPFGRILRDTNPGFQPFGYAGGLYDEDTSLVRFGARDYDPYLGRWLTRDSVAFKGGDNFYVYGNNAPVMWIDPTGNIPVVFYPFVPVASVLFNPSDANGGTPWGKAWGAPTSAIGLVWGGGGYLYNKIKGVPTDIRFENNSMSIYNHPVQSSAGAAITMGHVICYSRMNPTQDTIDHERQHTYQNEVYGIMYFPAHIMHGVHSYAKLGYRAMTGKESWKTLTDINHSWHVYNAMEHGPSQKPKSPWWF